MSLGNRQPAGQGMLPLRALLDALPSELPLSIEVLSQPNISLAEAQAWAAMLLETTRRHIGGAEA